MESTESAGSDRPPHIPVMGEEILALCHGRALRCVVDGTVGAGGHSALFLEQHPEIELLWGSDRDPEALALCAERFKGDPRVVLRRCQHTDLAASLQAEGIRPDLILLDLGVSSMQLDRPERGFSMQKEGPLDMRMDPDQALAAADIIGYWAEKELADLFFQLGEERRSRPIARAIVAARQRHPITTTRQLAAVIESVVPRTGKLHPATRVFQALRIAVNRELEGLEEALFPLACQLKQGGVMMVLTFHSLEDRLVKWAFRGWAQQGGWNILTKKVKTPSFTEVSQNRRARSAKLRAIQRGDECTR